MEERLERLYYVSLQKVSHVNCGATFSDVLVNYSRSCFCIVASALDDFEGERARGPPINSNNTVCSKSRPIVKLIGHIASTDQYCLTKVKTIFLFKYKSRNQLKSKSIRR